MSASPHQRAAGPSALPQRNQRAGTTRPEPEAYAPTAAQQQSLSGIVAALNADEPPTEPVLHRAPAAAGAEAASGSAVGDGSDVEIVADAPGDVAAPDMTALTRSSASERPVNPVVIAASVLVVVLLLVGLLVLLTG
jgi:hypothetical protein